MNDYVNNIYNEDCLSGMAARIPDKSIDMILTDLPYGITGCKWDSLIPFPALWEQFLRVAKDNAAIVLTAAQPFTTKLISSQPRLFKYCWYWNKNMVTGFANAKKQPLRCVEDVCVFYRKMPIYNPQGIKYYDTPVISRGKPMPAHGDSVYKTDGSLSHDSYQTTYNYPRQILNIKCERGLHPTQKPVELFEYMINTYTNPGHIILDCCMGSGTTKRAALNTGRKYTGFEIDAKYYKTACER